MDLEERLVRNRFDFQIIKRFEGNDGSLKFRVKYPTALFSTGDIALIDADKTQEEFKQAITHYVEVRQIWQQRWVVYFNHNELLKRKDANFEEAQLKEGAFKQIAEQEKIIVENIEKIFGNESLEFLTSSAETLYKRAEIIRDFLEEKLKWFRNEITKEIEEKNGAKSEESDVSIPIIQVEIELFSKRFNEALTSENRHFFYNAFINDYSVMEKHFAEMLNLSKEKIIELLDDNIWPNERFQRWVNENAVADIKERMIEIDYEERKKPLKAKEIQKANDDDSIKYTFLKEEWESIKLRFELKILSRISSEKWEFKHINGDIEEDNPCDVLDSINSEIQNKENEIAKWEKVDSKIIKLLDAVDSGSLKEDNAIRALALEANKILYNDVELQILKRNSGKSKFENLIGDKSLKECKDIVRTTIEELERIKNFLSEKLNWLKNNIAAQTEEIKTIANQYKVLCTIWTDIQIDREKELILLKGYDYARIDGNTLVKTALDVEWRKYDALYGNWIAYQKHSKETHKNNEEVLGWLNYNTYKILQKELAKLKTTEVEDAKWKQSSDAQMKKDYNVTLRDDLELPTIRNREREILLQAINELEMWYRKQNLNAPDLEMVSQMRQMEEKYYSEFEQIQKEREEMQWEIAKYSTITEEARIERESLERKLEAVEKENAPNKFRKVGDVWKVRYDNGDEYFIKEMVGMHYIALLLAKPQTDFNISDFRLQTIDTITKDEAIANGLAIASEYADNKPDDETIKQVKKGINNLSKELTMYGEESEEAEEMERELKKLKDYLARYDSNKPQLNIEAEKERKRISIAIKRAIQQISQQEESIGKYLNENIETGTYLRYKGDLIWDV